jgi:hypothetical protein
MRSRLLKVSRPSTRTLRAMDRREAAKVLLRV